MTNKVRVIFQSIFLGLIGYVAIRPLFDPAYVSDFEAYCPFGGIASLGSKLSQGTMSCNMSETQVLLGIGVIVGIIFIGKLFCSYVCPIGTVTEWLGKFGDKLKIRIDMPKILDRPLRSLKYGILFAALYYTMTSSELFCKEFDPYFASVNLFNNADIVLYFAIPAFILTILGSIFFRLFWCKYLCPLGAISNIFLNVVGAVVVILLFLIANYFGAGLSYIWLLLGLVLVGLANELGFMRSFLMPISKITRNTDTCSECGICDEECPQGIIISKFEKVNHIDCNLCSDCIHACPDTKSLTMNKSNKLKYLAPVATVVLILLSLGAAMNFEFTTISERWGNFDKNPNLAVYKQTGLKNIKCYGSSMSLKSQLESIDGISGLDTYAKSHSVVIYYDPKVISEKKVKKSLFTPTKMEVRKIKSGVDSLAQWQVGIYGLFDLYDFNNLFYTLKENEAVYGFETHFGEPVMANIFYDASKTNTQKLIAQIEKEFVMAKKAKATEKVELDFKVADKGVDKGFVTLDNYKQRIFRPYDRKFNDYKDFSPEQLSVFIFPMPEAGIPTLRRFFSSLTSHLSADEGIVRLSTRYTEVPSAFLYFDPSKTNVDKIKKALVKPMLTVFLSETETKDIVNPFHIKPDGKVFKSTEVKIESEDEIE
ncbi:MAG: 4Fe-4S binding protein [Ignavibacteriaceae bacterium]|nr:4Fe-4S binding protein [Ignavibacteriaceae bacterium]